MVNNATTENVFDGILDGADEIVYNDLSSDITDANFVAIKLGDANQDWSPDSSEAQQTTLGARDTLQVSDIIRLNALKPMPMAASPSMSMPRPPKGW